MNTLEVIIAKQTVSEGFYIMMRGHTSNPEFKSCVSTRLKSYEEAFWVSHTVVSALRMAGHEVAHLNDVWALKDANAYCEHMAFESLGVAK